MNEFRRFVEKILVDDGCWLWMASKQSKGYGQFRYNGTTKRAHRVSWELFVGEIPSGLCVLHHCDEPSCVNPAHLFLGTPLDNTRDMIRKGRDKHDPPQIGEEHHNSKVTELDVIRMRELYSSGNYRYTDLAAIFNISKITVGNIIRKETWTHI